MKMVKKVLLGLAAAATIMAFFGCKMVDDENGAIQGKNNDYTVDYTNESATEYRAYKSTSLQHAGALVKVTFENPNESSYCKMGAIFDLDEKNGKRSFYIMGLSAAKDKNFYVSRFENVSDIQDKNFGANDEASDPAVETVIWDNNTTNGIGSITRPALVDGKLTYYLYYKAFKNSGENPTKGYWEWGLYTFSDAEAELAKEVIKDKNANLASLNAIKTNVKAGTIEDAFDLKTGGGIPQNKVAVYAKIDAGKTLTGSWKYLDMYKEAEEIEE